MALQGCIRLLLLAMVMDDVPTGGVLEVHLTFPRRLLQKVFSVRLGKRTVIVAARGPAASNFSRPPSMRSAGTEKRRPRRSDII